MNRAQRREQYQINKHHKLIGSRAEAEDFLRKRSVTGFRQGEEWTALEDATARDIRVILSYHYGIRSAFEDEKKVEA